MFRYFRTMHLRVKTLLLLACLIVSHAPYAAEHKTQALSNDRELFAKALVLSREDKLAQAELLYRELIERNESWPEPKNNLAVILLQTNRVDDAKKLFESAVNSTTSYRLAQKNRSRLYEYLAKQAYDKALGVEPSSAVPKMQYIENIETVIEIQIIEKEIEVIVEVPISQPITSIDVKPSTTQVVKPNSNITETQSATAHRLKQQLLDWSQAWSQGDYETYLNIYSLEFIPTDESKNFQQWKESRIAKLRFTKNIQVSVGNVRVFLELDNRYALVEFDQLYQSATYSDKVLKQMYFKQHNNNWLILSERTISTY